MTANTCTLSRTCHWNRALLLCSLVVFSTQAATIDFKQPVPGGIFTDFTSADTLKLTAGADGTGTKNFRYTDSVHLIDFEFTADREQRAKLSLSDNTFNTFFAEAPGASKSSLRVVQSARAGRKGMDKDQTFSLALDGFIAGTTVTATPSVPEPSTLSSIAIGVLMLAAGVLRRTQHLRRE
jgi:hypothetical protein